MQHLHYNKIAGPKTILLTIIISTLTISSIIVVSETPDQLFAKSAHSSTSTPSTSGGLGSSSSSNNSSTDNGGSKRATTNFNTSPGSIDPTHCDQAGYPSCYTLGYSDGQANPGTSCPSGHSSAYCDGYNAGSRAAVSSSSLTGSQGNNFAPENGGTGSRTGTNHHGAMGSKVNLSQLGQTSTTVGVINTTGGRVNSESHIGNNANLNSNLLGLLSSHKSKVHDPSSSIIHQKSNVNINQTGQSNSKLAIANSSGIRVNTKSNIGNGVDVNSNLLNLLSSSHQSGSHRSLSSVKQNTKTNINQTGHTNTGINVTSSPNSNINSKSNVNNNAKVSSNLNNPSSSSTTYHYSPSSITQKSEANVKQAGRTNTNVNVTNSPSTNVNSQSSISNNAKLKSNVINGPSSSSSTYTGTSSSPSSVTQNSKTTVNQGAQNNANINVNNSPGTRITNEQTIKQSVRINNEVNNIIKNNEVNNIIRQNTVSAPLQPLTDIVTVKLAKSSMSSGALFPLADIEPYRVIGGHITANLPSSSQQNIVVAQISDNGQIQHAVILDLKQITGSNLDQNSLYETSLGSDISGTNPFTGNSDEVSSITNLFLWNNNQQSIVFDNANGVTMNLIYK